MTTGTPRLCPLAGALLLAAGCYVDPAVTDALLAGADFARQPGAQTGGAVLDTGPPDSWRGQTVGEPTVVLHDGLFFMWFAGTAVVGDGESPYLFRSAIGAAMSLDGIDWTLLNGGEPVLGPGPPGGFDSHSVGHPHVLRTAGGFLMWYGGADGSQGPDSVRVERIGLATSPDGIHWTRANGGASVIDLGGPGEPDTIQATAPAVVRTPSGFRMYYGAYDGQHTIAAAVSEDGVTWHKTSVAGLGPDETLGPSVIRHGADYFMLYSVPRDGRWTAVGARSLDGETWTPIRGGMPALPPAPDGGFDDGGAGQNHSVHPSQPLVAGNRLRIWYVGESAEAPFRQRIGLMEAPLPPLGAAADLTGDGRADLLWQDDSEGWLAAWAMDGPSLLSSDLLSPPRVPQTNWKIVGTGDLNGDGHVDLVWQDVDEGWLAAWTMDRGSMVSSDLLVPSRVADTAWRVAGVVDLDGDMRPDLLWRERTEGWVGAWLMQGLALGTSLALSPARVADADWEIVGHGDLNGDGTADLIWRHRRDGWLAAWLMDDTRLIDSVLLTPSRVADPDWEIVATLDLDGDGYTDLIWRERVSGWLVIWRMRGTRLIESVDLTPNRVPQRHWRIVGPR